MQRHLWLIALMATATFSSVTRAATPDDVVGQATVKRARIAFDARPDAGADDLRGTAALHIRIPRDELEAALQGEAQPIRVTLAQAVLFDGVDTSALQPGRRGRLEATRERADGDDRLRIDARRGRLHLRVRGGLLSGLAGAAPTDVQFEVRIGECVWTETLFFDRRRPRAWSIRRVRIPCTEIRNPHPARNGRIGCAWALRTRNQLVELQRRYGERGAKAAQLRRDVDFDHEMVVAVLGVRNDSTIEIHEPLISPSGVDVAFTEHRPGAGCYSAFFVIFIDPVYRVIPRSTGPVAFEPRVELHDCR
jgi:hypothetical protein